MSYHRLHTKPLNATLSALLKRGAHLGVGIGAFAPVLALANPTGGQVVAGQATIATPNLNGMVINQSSQSAVINWQQFNIGKGQYVQFIQPSSSSVVLNRVVGGTPSLILGSLKANGQVFLVNSNGVFFGKTAVLDVQGILASTLNIDNSSFMSGNYLFDQPGAAGATVVNQGHIRAHNGGYVVLAGDYSENSGIITAQSGHIILASGTKATLSLNGNNLVNFAVNQATLANYAGVENSGSLIADGGTVIMTADVANALKATVVNNTGLVEAHAMSAEGGHIYLTATGGNIQNSGTLDANATHAGQAGGDIVLKGDARTILTDASQITATGDGAKGGSLEISGNTINVRGAMKLGQGGNLLLDPNKITLINGTGNGSGHLNSGGEGEGSSVTVGVGFIETQLNSGVNVAVSAHNFISHSGNVHSISATGKGDLTFKTGVNGHVNLTGVNITIAGNLTASMGYGHFGYLQAAAIQLVTSSGGSISLPDAVANAGVISKYSAKTTKGNLDISAKHLTMSGGSGEAGLALKAKTGITLEASIGTTSVAFADDVTLSGASVDDEHIIHTSGNVSVTASHGYASVDTIVANDITLSAKGGHLSAGNLHGQMITVTDASGDMRLANVNGDTGITLKDTGGNMTVGLMSAAEGSIAVNDAGHALSFDASNSGNAVVKAGGNVTLTAKTIGQTGEVFNVTAGGDLTVKGQISLAENQTSFSAEIPHDLQLQAGGTISLDHGVAVPGSVDIVGGHLAYTGTGKTFALSAGYGNLNLDASIGSAAHPVKYNVNLADHGYGIYIQRSIYTGSTAQGAAANITATETGLHSGGPGPSFVGVLLGDSTGGRAVTLSATKGSVTLKGEDVGVGDVLPGSNDFGPITVKAGQNVTFSASGASSHGHVGIKAQKASTTGTSSDKSILVQAGGNLKLKGANVNISGGRGDASMSAADSGSASVKTGVTLSAKGSVDINASSVNIHAGQGFAEAKGSSGEHRHATVDSSVTITAGKAITVSANGINVSGGYGVARASGGEGASDTAVADTGVSLKAGTDITLTAGSNGIQVAAANGEGFDNSAHAHGGAKASASASGDVNFTAKGGIKLSGENLFLQAGQDVGGNGRSSTDVKASSGGRARLAAIADLNLSAGAGGITLTGNLAIGSVAIEGGDDAGEAVKAKTDTGTGSFDAEARVNLTTKGDIAISGHDVKLLAGSHLALNGSASGAESGATKVSVDGGVGLKAADITITASQSASFIGGSHVAYNAVVNGDFGQASIGASGRVDLTATTGNISVTAGGRVFVEAGYGAAQRNGALSGSNVAAFGHGAKAAVQGDAGVSLTAKGKISLTGGSSASSDFVRLQGGFSAGSNMRLNAQDGGSVAVTGLARVDVQAGAFSAKAHNVSFAGGPNAARRGLAQASGSSSGYGAQAHLSADGGVSVQAGSVTVQAGNTLALRAGNYAGINGAANANGSLTSATLSGKADVDVTTPGALKLSADDMYLFGGGSLGDSASAHAGGGKANLAASGQVNLQGASLTLTATSGEVYIEAGYGGARVASAMASDGGQAAVDSEADISLTATGGNISVKGKGGVYVEVGYGVGQGHSSYHSSNSFISSGGSGPSYFSNAQRNRSRYDFYTQAGAFGSGATASVTAGAGVSLSATGGISLAASNGAVVLEAGYGAGNVVRSLGSDGGSAKVTVNAGISLVAQGKLGLSGKTVDLEAGGGAARGAQSSFSVQQVEHCVNSVGCNFLVSSSFHNGSDGQQAKGAGAKANLSVNNAVTIKAGTVSLTAGASNAVLSGGDYNGSHALVDASNGGAAGATLVSGVSITATGAFTMTAKNEVEIRGGSHSGERAKLNAQGNGATAGLGLAGGVTITASTVTLAAAQEISIGGGRSAGYGAQVEASNGGHADEDVATGTTLTAKSAFSATLTGKTSGGTIHLFTQGRAGSDARVSADTNGVATLEAHGDLNITVTAAGGTLTIGAGSHTGAELSISAGGRVGAYAEAVASRGTASMDLSADLTLSAKGAVSLDAGKSGDFFIGQGQDSAGRDVSMFAVDGKAAIHAGADTTVTGGTVSLNAGDGLTLKGGAAENASHAEVSAASNGTASLDVSVETSIKAATGALTLNAGSDLTIIGAGNSSDGNAYLAKLNANGNKAVADLTLDQGVSLSGTTGVTLKAGLNVQIEGNTDGQSGQSASVTAGARGTATFSQHTNVTITTGGLFSAKAGGDLSILGASEMGESAQVHATGPGAKAVYLGDGTVNLSAASVKLSASDEINVVGGRYAGYSASVTAGQGGSASLHADGGVNITAKTAFTATLSGKNSSGHIYIYAGRGTGKDAIASASKAGSKAVVNASGGVSINVTAGGLTVTTGNHQSASIYVGGSESAGRSASASAAHGGVATVTARNDVSLSAKGAVSLNAVKGDLSLDAGYRETGLFIFASASAAGKAAVTAESNLTVTGASVTLNAGHDLLITNGSSTAGYGAGALAKNGGSAVATVNARLNIVTAGAFSAKAGGDLSVIGASDLGGGAHVLASHAGAKATTAFNGSLAISAKTLNLSAGSDLSILGGASGAFNGSAVALNGGTATISANAGVSLTATGGGITVKGAKGVHLAGGDHAAAGSGATSQGSGGNPSFNRSGSFYSASSSHFRQVTRTTTAVAEGNHATATITANAGVNLTATGAISVTQTSTGGSLAVLGGGQAASEARAIANGGGDAAVNALSGVSLKAGTGVTLQGANVAVVAGGGAAQGVPSSFHSSNHLQCTSLGGCVGVSANRSSAVGVRANGGGATAALTAASGVTILAASVSVKATGAIFLGGGFQDAHSAQAQAGFSGDKAAISVDGTVVINATGAVSLAGSQIAIIGGAENGVDVQLKASRAFAQASLDMDDSVNITAGGAFTAKAAGGLSISGGNSMGASATVFANGSGAKASLTATGKVGISAKSIALTAASGNVSVGGGNDTAVDAVVIGESGGSAALKGDATVDLSATGAVSLTATAGSVDIHGGGGSFVFAAPRAIAFGGSASAATASLDDEDGVTIAAGSTLTIKAGNSINVDGGSGNFASVMASHGGSGKATLNAGAKLTAGGSANLTAGTGSLAITGGAVNGIALNLFPSFGATTSQAHIPVGPSGGKLSGQLDASVSLNAGGNVNLKAGGDLTVAAGEGVTLQVGAIRDFLPSGLLFVGAAWGGGTADLTGDVSATVTAGKNLTLTAGAGGAGNLEVDGLRKNPLSSSGFINVAAVRGGSSGAVANVTLNGNATLSAGSDLVINAKGNASIIGGQLTNLRADHTRGTIIISGSADATLHAGHDVVLNSITGSLTVAGINVNSSHAGEMLVDAFGSSGRASVTGHADASISAKNDITTVKQLGGGFNVIAGGQVEAVALGSHSSASNKATASANAGLNAGGSITISAKGDMNVLGGLRGSASANPYSNAAPMSDAAHTAALSLTAGINAVGAVSLTAGGSGVIAAGDSLKATAFVGLGAFQFNQATVDGSVSITGSSLTLTVGDNLLVRGGSGDGALAGVSSGGVIHATAAVKAGTTLSATGNMAIKVGTGHTGDASFIAGSNASGLAFAAGGSDSASAQIHNDLTVKAGGNMSLTVAGNLVIAGGPLTEAPVISNFAAAAFGNGNTARANVTAATTFTAGGTLTVTLAGGDVALLGGSGAAESRGVFAVSGSGDQASLNVDSSLTVHAGGAIKLTGAGAVAISAGRLPTSSSFPVAFAVSGPASLKANSSVTISGHTVNINNATGVTTHSSGLVNSFGVSLNGTVKITAVMGAPIFGAPAPLVLHGSSLKGYDWKESPLGATSFLGAPRLLPSGSPLTAPALGTPLTLTGGGLQVQAVTATTLGTLESQSLVLHLVPLLAAPAVMDLTGGASDFTPAAVGRGSMSSFGGDCKALLLADSGHYRCPDGGK